MRRKGGMGTGESAPGSGRRVADRCTTLSLPRSNGAPARSQPQSEVNSLNSLQSGVGTGAMSAADLQRELLAQTAENQRLSKAFSDLMEAKEGALLRCAGKTGRSTGAAVDA